MLPLIYARINPEDKIRVKNLVRQASSFIPPILFCIVIPYFLVRGEHKGYFFNPSFVLEILGGLIICGGLLIFIITTRLIILIGKGTIMPWDPSRSLVVAGIYQYVRNPMILSVILIETGEALLFASIWLGILGLIFFIINHIYFVFSEEPGLEKRFGDEYIEYKKNVPRWIPRLSPWKPG